MKGRANYHKYIDILSSINPRFILDDISVIYHQHLKRKYSFCAAIYSSNSYRHVLGSFFTSYSARKRRGKFTFNTIAIIYF